MVTVMKENEYREEEKEVIPCLRQRIRHPVVYSDQPERQGQQKCAYDDEQKVQRPDTSHSSQIELLYADGAGLVMLFKQKVSYKKTT